MLMKVETTNENVMENDFGSLINFIIFAIC